VSEHVQDVVVKCAQSLHVIRVLLRHGMNDLALQAVHGRVHALYTAVNTACTWPWTRLIHGRVHGRVHGRTHDYVGPTRPCSRPCTGRVLGRVRGVSTAVYGPCTRIDECLHSRVEAA